MDKKQNLAAAALKELSDDSTRPAFVQEQLYASIIAETILKGEKFAKGADASTSFTEGQMEKFWNSKKTLLQTIFGGKGGVVRNKG